MKRNCLFQTLACHAIPTNHQPPSSLLSCNEQAVDESAKDADVVSKVDEAKSTEQPTAESSKEGETAAGPAKEEETPKDDSDEKKVDESKGEAGAKRSAEDAAVADEKKVRKYIISCVMSHFVIGWDGIKFDACTCLNIISRICIIELRLSIGWFTSQEDCLGGEGGRTNR